MKFLKNKKRPSPKRISKVATAPVFILLTSINPLTSIFTRIMETVLTKKT